MARRGALARSVCGARDVGDARRDVLDDGLDRAAVSSPAEEPAAPPARLIGARKDDVSRPVCEKHRAAEAEKVGLRFRRLAGHGRDRRARVDQLARRQVDGERALEQEDAVERRLAVAVRLADEDDGVGRATVRLGEAGKREVGARNVDERRNQRARPEELRQRLLQQRLPPVGAVRRVQNSARAGRARRYGLTWATGASRPETLATLSLASWTGKCVHIVHTVLE